MSNGNKLVRSTPEEQGINSEAVLDFLENIEGDNLGLHSFMLLRHGFVVSEGWWAPYSEDSPHMLFSLSKSFTSTAIGLAVEEKLLTVEDKVISFFTEELPEKIDENLAQMKIKHLLTMGTGHEKDTTDAVVSQKDGDWVKGFLGLKVERTPGTHFIYNTGATYMLSAIIQKVTGETLYEYLQPRLFKPLGIENATWETCPKGINTGGFGLSIKTEDIAKFGQLYLQKGIYEGKRLVSEDWIEEATSKQISNGTNEKSDWEQGYGYQFWRCCHNNTYRADGAFGQFAIVMPDEDVVIAITSGSSDTGAILNLIWEKLAPAISKDVLTSNNEGVLRLNRKLASLTIPALTLTSYSERSEKIYGKIYKIYENQFEIQTMAFKFHENICSFTTSDNRGQHEISCGIGAWLCGETDIILEASKTYASGTWKDPETFIMTWIFVETPFCYTLTCNFNELNLNVEIDINLSMGPIEFKALEGKQLEE